jgi:ABC-type arginine/histidine transport system permease subunit
MMTVARELFARYYNPFQTYITVGIVYLIIIGVITVLLNHLEKRLTIPGMELDKRGA